MIETIEQANTILGPLCDTDEGRYAINQPFGYIYAGERFVGATDARQATFIQTSIELPPARVDFSVIFAKYHPGAGNTFTVKFTDLLAFAGEPVFDMPCKRCKGKGFYGKNNQFYCKPCDGDGVIVAPMRPGFFDKVQIDRNRLARSLRAVPPVDRCELTLPDDYVGRMGHLSKPVFIIGEGWWIILMPMRLSPGSEDSPRFELNK